MIGNELSFSSIVRLHTENLFDQSYFTFHNSFDGTKECFDQTPNIKIRVSNEKGYPQATISNQMLREAFSSGADVCIPLDADEFLPFENQADLKQFLEKFLGKYDYILIPWRNCAPDQFPINSNFSNLKYSHEFSSVHKVIVFKSAFEKDPNLQLSQGNHLIRSQQNLKWKIAENCHLVHIPFRSQLHYARKMLQGASIMFEEKKHDLSDHWIDGAKKPFISNEELFEISMDYGEKSCTSHPLESWRTQGFILGAEYFEQDEVITFNKVMAAHWEGISAMLGSVNKSDRTALEFAQLQRRLEKLDVSSMKKFHQLFQKLKKRIRT
jgi:hypothetical protein